MEERERAARMLVRRAKEKAHDVVFSKEGNRRFFRAVLEQQDVNFLVAAAREGDKDAIDILRVYARGARRAGMNVPDDFHAFVWEHFIDGPPKAKPGTSSKDIDLRNQALSILVKIVRDDFGFPEYSRYEDRDDPDAPMTACRLVAEEFGLDERTVEEIWTERKEGVTRPPNNRPN
jgi:hypothetical protein